MSTSITCYGGAGEIGGNKLLVEDGSTRILLDFGIAFGRLGEYYNEFLKPRAARGLLDPLMVELIPPLEGIYRKDLALPGLWGRVRSYPAYRKLTRNDRDTAIDGVLLSHAHLDHSGDISYLDEHIPIFTSRVSAFISRTMQVTGLSSMEREMVFIGIRGINDNGVLKAEAGNKRLRPHHFLDGELSSEASEFWYTAGMGKNKEMGFAIAKRADKRINENEIKWWQVDHSIPGAVGYAIKTSAGWIGYTGDIRFHGKIGHKSAQFVEELASLKPTVLLCEGTHTEKQGEAAISEEEIVERALEIVLQNRGKLIVADFGPRNLERLFSFLEIAKQSGRLLLVQPKDVYLLEAIHLADASYASAPDGMECLRMYADPKAAPRGWEVELRERWQGKMIGPGKISMSPGDYILADSLWDLNDFPDLEGIEGGAYLFSNSKAYDDEQKADLERMRAWVRWLGLRLYGDPEDEHAVRLHASGHAAGNELAQLVKTVQPKVLIPIHTEDPNWWLEQLHGTDIRIQLPEYGKGIWL